MNPSDLRKRFEAAWNAVGPDGGPPDWRQFLLPTDDPDAAEHLCDIFKADLERRLDRPGVSPPLARGYADTDEGRRLDPNALYSLINHEYQLCWARGIRSVNRDVYRELFRDEPILVARIDADLWPVWECPACGGQVPETDENRDVLVCPHCTAVAPRSDLAHPSDVRAGIRTVVPHPAGPPSPDPDHPLPIVALGGYELRRWIGEGGMAEVFEGWDPHLGVEVAIKILRRNLANQATARSRFVREARAAARIRHDCVVRILKFGEEHGFTYLVMPLLHGETLRSRLQRDERLPVEDGVRIGGCVAEALAAAAEIGLVHRDVTPSNIWLETLTGGGWRAVVLDFGLARSSDGRDAVTQDHAVSGTPLYMSPEQARGDDVDGRSDLFSLGTVLYEAVVGRPAFRGNAWAAMTAIKDRDFMPPLPHVAEPSVPSWLSDVITRLLAKNPDERFQSAVEVVAALKAQSPTPPAATSHGDRAGQHPPDSIHARRTKNARPRLIALGVTLLIAIGIVVLLARGDGQAPVNRPEPDRTAGEPTRGSPVTTTPVTGTPDRRTASPEAVPTPVDGDLDVRIDGVGDGDRKYLGLDDPGVLPLKSDDGYIIVATVKRPVYAYIVLIKPDGEVKPVYPWTKPGDWASRPADETPVTPQRPFVFQPPAGRGEWWQIPTGPPGMLTLMMLTRDDPLPPDADVAKLIGRVEPQKEQHPRAKAWFENGVMVRGRPRRDPDFEAKPGSDPVLDVQRRVRDHLLGEGKPFTYSLAVTFATEGRSGKP